MEIPGSLNVYFSFFWSYLKSVSWIQPVPPLDLCYSVSLLPVTCSCLFPDVFQSRFHPSVTLLLHSSIWLHTCPASLISLVLVFCLGLSASSFLQFASWFQPCVSLPSLPVIDPAPFLIHRLTAPWTPAWFAVLSEAPSCITVSVLCFWVSFWVLTVREVRSCRSKSLITTSRGGGVYEVERRSNTSAQRYMAMVLPVRRWYFLWQQGRYRRMSAWRSILPLQGIDVLRRIMSIRSSTFEVLNIHTAFYFHPNEVWFEKLSCAMNKSFSTPCCTV